MNISRACKKLAVILTFVMTAGGAVPGAEAERVYAIGQLEIIAESMTIGPTLASTTPERNPIAGFTEADRYREDLLESVDIQETIGRLDSQLVMSVPDVMTGEPFFALEYPLENERKVIVKVERKNSPTVFEVSYHLQKYVENAPAAEDPDEDDWVDIKKTDAGDFKVYFNGEVRYVTPGGDYTFSRTDNNGKPIYGVVDDSIPRFIINDQPTDKGFSFQYAGRTVHFLLENGTFYYATDGIADGRIYDFWLKKPASFNDEDMNAAAPTTASYYAYPNPDFSVTSNNPDVEGGYDEDHGATSPTALETVTEGKEMDADKIPGADEQWLSVTFPQTTRWNEAEHSFSALTDDAGINIQMTLNLKNDYLGGNTTKKSFTVYDAQKEKPSDVRGAGTAGTSSFTDIEYIDHHNDGTYTVVVGNMKAGQMYYGEVTGIFSGNAAKIRAANLEFGSAYTLLKYSLVGDKIKIWPYEGVTGTYVIGARPNAEVGINLREYPDGINPDHVVTSIADVAGESDGQGGVLPITPLKPVPVTELEGNFYNYRVMFIYRDNSNIKRPSQPLYARLAPFDDLRRPSELRADAALTRAEKWFTGEKGDLELKLTWDLGVAADATSENEPVTVEDILASRGDLTLAYDIGKTLSPEARPMASNAGIFVELKLDIGLGSDGAAEYKDHRWEDPLGVLKDVRDVGLSTELKDGVLHYFVSATFDIAAVREDYDKNAAFVYPSNYFVNVELKSSGEGNTYTDYISPFANITLNNIVPPELTPPINPSIPESGVVSEVADNKENVRFSYNFETPDIRSFMSYYAGESAEDISFNLYISQVENGSETVETSPQAGAGGELSFSGGSAMAVSGREAREALRENKVVKVVGAEPASGTGQSFVFSGLDANQKYYVYSEMVVNLTSGSAVGALWNKPEEQPPAGVERKPLIFTSGVSELASVTTKGIQASPAPGEKTPSAPESLRPRAGEGTDTSGVIEWISQRPQSGMAIEYEILRVRSDDKLDPNATKDQELMADRGGFARFWGKLSPSLAVKTDYAQNAASNHAVRTSGGELKRWNGSEFVTVENIRADFGYDPADADGNIWAWYEDQTLSPNQIYFYYVRTVQIVDGEESYSSWVRTTLTTNPVKPASNLRIVPSGAGHAYDIQTEIMFAFTTEDIAPADVSDSGFSFWYELKKEGEGWGSPVKMDRATLDRWAASLGQGRYEYMYRVSGLEAGTSYSIRVYVQDSGGNKSLYAGPVEFRTETDQKDYDDQQLLGRWREYFMDLLQKLLKDPYWSLSDTSGRLESVYRPTMFSQLITGAQDANINLRQGAGTRAVYHIPASSLISANDAGKGLRIVYDNTEIIIPPSAFDMNLNTAIADLNADVKTGDIADYYVTVEVEWRHLSTVDGAEAATYETAVRFGALESDVTAERWDKDMFTLLADEAIRRAEDEGVLDDLQEMVEDGEASEEIIKYIEDIINETARDFSSTLRDEFNDVTGADYTLAINKQYTFIGKDKDSVVVGSGYEYTGGAWVRRETAAYGAGQAMRPAAAGTFIFAGRPSTIPGLSGAADGAAISALVYKYNLEDYFGKLSYETLELNANRDMLAGAAARIAGAPRGADSIGWLNQNKKMALSTRNSQSPVEAQEALYIMASLYEFKTSRPVASVQIRNYALTNNMQGLEAKYKTHVRAAFELGIYTDAAMRPAQTLKVRDILKILAELDKRVKL